MRIPAKLVVSVCFTLIFLSCTMLADLSRKRNSNDVPGTTTVVHIETPWTKTFGGSSDDTGVCVAADELAHLMVAGNFKSTVDFDPDTNATSTNSTNYSAYDAFLSRFDTGGTYYWTRTFGGNVENFPFCVALSGTGDCYLTGIFSGTVNFGAGTNTNLVTSVGVYDVFLTKYDLSGNRIWTKTFGSMREDHGRAVAVDHDGNILVTGTFTSNCDFDPSTGVDMKAPSAVNSSDVFLQKMLPDGSYGWTVVCGGSGDEQVSDRGLAVDSDGNAYICGYFTDTADFDPTGGIDNRTANGGYDCFLLKILANGQYGWVRTFGGAGDDRILAVSVDRSNNVYVSGFFNGTVDFDPGYATNKFVSAGSADMFVSKFRTDGTYLWTDVIGGAGDDRATGLTTDLSNNIYLTGYFNNICDFDPTSNTNMITNKGDYDAFLSQLQPDGSYGWTKQFGGTTREYGFALTCNRLGNVFMTGYFEGSTDFDPSTNSDARTSKGSWDVFLLNSAW